MLLAYRLVRLIETHSDQLAKTLLRRVQQSELTQAYGNVPAEELKQRVREIYLHLGEWLLTRSALDIDTRYAEIGARRARQRIPLSQVIWAIILTKETLWGFVQDEAVLDRPLEIFGELALLQSLERFFDRATHAAAVGYERASAECAREEAAMEPIRS